MDPAEFKTMKRLWCGGASSADHVNFSEPTSDHEKMMHHVQERHLSCRKVRLTLLVGNDSRHLICCILSLCDFDCSHQSNYTE